MSEVPESIDFHGREDSVCKLNETLYELKLAPIQWNEKIDIFLFSGLNFEKCQYDPWLYMKHGKNKNMIIIINFYVEDLLIAETHMESLHWMKRQLNQKLEIKDLGETKICLRLQISRDHTCGTLSVSQPHYINRILK